MKQIIGLPIFFMDTVVPWIQGVTSNNEYHYHTTVTIVAWRYSIRICYKYYLQAIRLEMPRPILECPLRILLHQIQEARIPTEYPKDRYSRHIETTNTPPVHSDACIG